MWHQSWNFNDTPRIWFVVKYGVLGLGHHRSSFSVKGAVVVVVAVVEMVVVMVMVQ